MSLVIPPEHLVRQLPTVVGRVVLTAFLFLAVASAASAQQRPLLTEDPECIGAGRMLLEGGVDYRRGELFTASGLEGNLLRLPTFGVSVGLSSIAELQVDGGFSRLEITKRRPGPLADAVTVPGTTTSDFEDLVVATKIRFASETPGHPAFAVRLATKLPNASNASGLGLDTIDFYTSLLVGKTVRSVRVVGNVGVGILGDPIRGNQQNDVLTYGVSIARAVSDSAELVGEINGRADTKAGDPPPGTESRATMRLGARLTKGTVRLDGAVLVGVTSRDPLFGFTGGFTYVFNAFTIP